MFVFTEAAACYYRKLRQRNEVSKDPKKVQEFFNNKETQVHFKVLGFGFDIDA